MRKSIALILAAATLWGLHARADGYLLVEGNINGGHRGTNGFQHDFVVAVSTNATCGVFDSLHLTGAVSFANAYMYYDLQRNVIASNVYHTMHITGAAIDSAYVGTPDNEDATAMSTGTISVTEDMILKYFPDSDADIPPTSVSFQMSYLVQGNFGSGTNWQLDASPSPSNANGDYNSGEFPGSVLSPRTNITSDIFTEVLDRRFQIKCTLAGAPNAWGAPASDSPQSMDLSYYFEGFVNIVDQNNEPIPSNKIKFYCINATNLAEQVGSPTTVDQSLETRIYLQVANGTNGIIVQWPYYATNYLLQTTGNLANSPWANYPTVPSVSGPFLQVNVPTTNAAGYFRLQQTN